MAFSLDWKMAAVLAMLCLVAYNIALKTFFVRGYDLRALIPFVFLGVLVAFAYFAYSYREVRFTSETIPLTLVILLALALATALGWYAMASGSVSVYAAVLAVSTPLTALAAYYLIPNESLTSTQWAGVLLGLVSLVLVTKG